MSKRIIFLIGNMALSWISVIFIGKKAVKKYSIASLLITLLVHSEFYFARKRRWWWFYRTKIFEGIIPIHWGPFLVGCMWMLKLTYGKFKSFLFLNGIMSFIYTFPGVWLFKLLRLVELGRMKRTQLFSLMMSNMILLYGFQLLIEKYKGLPMFMKKKKTFWKVR